MNTFIGGHFMDIALEHGIDFNWIRNITNICKLSNIEKLLSDCLENLPEKSALDYIGELNKNMG
jgi:hypothetical protein